jgi:hypothetical protein
MPTAKTCSTSFIPSRTRPGFPGARPRRPDARDTRRSPPSRRGFGGRVAHGASRSLQQGVEPANAGALRILREEEKRAPMLMHDRKEARLRRHRPAKVRLLPVISRRVEDSSATGARRPWAPRLADADVRRRIAPTAAVFKPTRPSAEQGEHPLDNARSLATTAGFAHNRTLRPGCGRGVASQNPNANPDPASRCPPEPGIRPTLRNWPGARLGRGCVAPGSLDNGRASTLDRGVDEE